MAKQPQSSFRGKVAANAQRTAGNGGSGYIRAPKGISFFNPDPESTVKLDFIPYVVTDPKHPDRDASTATAVEDSLWWRRPYKVHKNVGAGLGDTVVCPSSVGKRCPICEEKARMVKMNAKKEDTKELNTSKRNLYIVIPRNHKKLEEVPHLFDISDFLFQELLTKELKSDPEKEIFPDLKIGLTLKVRFEPGDMPSQKPYAQADRIDFEERDVEYEESLLEDVPNLDEVLVIMTYEELKAKFLEIDPEDVDSESTVKEMDEEEEAPRAKKTIAKKRPAPAEEEEEEEEETAPVKKTGITPKRKPQPVEEEEEEEEEETAPPVKRTVSKSKPAPVEEEEEEEEAPKPIKKSSMVVEKVCPHKLRFGTDAGEYDVCDSCNLWKQCVEAGKTKK